MKKWQTEPILNVLLSYPRSGNTWCRYCVEFLTKMPTNGTCGNNTEKRNHVKPIGELTDIGVDCDQQSIMHKFHKYDGISIEDGIGLVVLVRNYRECIPRHLFSGKADFKKGKWRKQFHESCCGENYGVSYVGILEYYDKWPYDKYLIYYEDLIEKPLVVLTELVEFLGFQPKWVKKFVDNISEHKKKSLSVYNTWSFSATKGANFDFHSSMFTKDELEWMDRHVREQNEYVFKKYLRKYTNG